MPSLLANAQRLPSMPSYSTKQAGASRRTQGQGRHDRTDLHRATANGHNTALAGPNYDNPAPASMATTAVSLGCLWMR